MAQDNGTWFHMDDVQFASYLKEQGANEGEALAHRQECQKAAAILERAFQMLEVYGVTRDRMRTISNGIDVLATRYSREVAAVEESLHRAHVINATQRRELERMRAMLEQQTKKKAE